MKIAFFGDSFCAKHDYDGDYQTYIKKIQHHYDADIVHLGIGGSSVFDVMLRQVPEFLEKNSHPDVCVFVWTAPTRLYHRHIRHINYSKVSEDTHTTDVELWSAAKQFYKHLYDPELMQFQYQSSLYYFDRTVLSTFPTTTKIIHLWSYDDEYYYRWHTGVEVRPALNSISKLGEIRDMSRTFRDPSPNHLKGDDKNQLVFSWIQESINYYNAGRLFEMSL